MYDTENKKSNFIKVYKWKNHCIILSKDHFLLYWFFTILIKFNPNTITFNSILYCIISFLIKLFVNFILPINF